MLFSAFFVSRASHARSVGGGGGRGGCGGAAAEDEWR